MIFVNRKSFSDMIFFYLRGNHSFVMCIYFVYHCRSTDNKTSMLEIELIAPQANNCRGSSSCTCTCVTCGNFLRYLVLCGDMDVMWFTPKLIIEYYCYDLSSLPV